MSRLDPLFMQMRQEGYSDLHLSAGSPPRVRARGELETLPLPPMSGEEIGEALGELLTAEQAEEFALHHDVELTCALPGVGRLRGSYFLTAAGPSASFRFFPETPVRMETLMLPAGFESLLEKRAGLIVCALPRGAGRSTLLASLVDRIHGSSPRRVVSLEEPVETIHSRKQGVVLQREVPGNARDFAAGIRGALRFDAEVLVIGDLPDTESVALALRAAEGGRLVIAFSTAPSAPRALERMVESAPASLQGEVASLLADNLLAVLAQVLLRRRDGPGSVAAHELLLATPELKACLKDGDLRAIPAALDAGRGAGMISLDDSIGRLVEAKVVTAEEAQRKASDKSRFAG